jgi:2-polyprenyl-3-methyl-5-hydroxy-6-metoxy-1,4-benzoquinol methylase
MTIFDLGAGEGCFVHTVADEFPRASVYAVEADERVKSKFYGKFDNVHFVPMYIENFLQRELHSVHRTTPNLVVLTDVLEHVLSPEEMLGTVAKVLPAGGYAYLTVPNANTFESPFPYPEKSENVDWVQANRTCQHLWLMTPSLFGDLVRRHFRIVDETDMETSIRKDSVYSTILAQKL